MVFSTNNAGTTGYPHAKNNNNLDKTLHPLQRVNSNWITDLSVKHKTIKLLEESGRKLR